MAEQPFMLRVIFSDAEIRKLVLNEFPETVEELKNTVKDEFELACEFRLQYLDPDFNNFINVSSITDIGNKGTLKVVTLSVSESDSSSVSLVEETSDENISSDTIIITPDDRPLSASSFSDSQIRANVWPVNFQVPKFSYDLELKLKQANEMYAEDGTLIDMKTVSKSVILDRMAEQIFQFKAYPTDMEVNAAARALVTTHPCLREPVSSGYYGWKTSLKFKMGNYRTKLRNAGCTELRVNSLEAKREGEKAPAKNIKNPRKSEVNYLPSSPEHETEQSLEKHRSDLVEEMKKRNPNERLVSDKMGMTFAKRRQEIIMDRPMVNEVKERWPALFTPIQLNAEFKRITTTQLTPVFMKNLDQYTDTLIEAFSGKGGAQGRKMKDILQVVENAQNNVSIRREATLKCLCHYLGEESEHLVKEFEDTLHDEDVRTSFKSNPIAIYVIRREGETAVEPPADTGVFVEGSEVICNIPSVGEACALVMGLIYALDLVYPKDLKYYYEACQKIFLGLGDGKISPKVHALKKRLATAGRM